LEEYNNILQNTRYVHQYYFLWRLLCLLCKQVKPFRRILVFNPKMQVLQYFDT